jgi:hypothetical protein
MESFFNHSQSIKLKTTSLMGMPDRLQKPAFLRIVLALPDFAG